MRITRPRNFKTGIGAVLLVAGVSFASASFAAKDADKKGHLLRGVKAWAANCSRCHNVRDPKELRDDQWITTTFHMRLRAGLTGQETRDIITFLQSSN